MPARVAVTRSDTYRAGEAGIASYYDYVSLTGGVFF